MQALDEVLPVGLAEVERAKTILLGHPRLTARDAVHLATMERHKVAALLSFDAGFDGYPGVKRES